MTVRRISITAFGPSAGRSGTTGNAELRGRMKGHQPPARKPAAAWEKRGQWPGARAATAGLGQVAEARSKNLNTELGAWLGKSEGGRGPGAVTGTRGGWVCCHAPVRGSIPTERDVLRQDRGLHRCVARTRWDAASPSETTTRAFVGHPPPGPQRRHHVAHQLAQRVTYHHLLLEVTTRSWCPI